MKKIILASQSVQRRLLMETLGLPFEVMPTHVDEKAITHADAQMRAQLVARAKAATVMELFKQKYPEREAVIIAADTFGFLDDQEFEKPASKEEAIEMLTKLTSGTSIAITGFCVIDTALDTTEMSVVVTKMRFRDLSASEISKYVQENDVTSWSGGFSPAYDAGAALIDSIEGSLTSFSHGLPMELVVPALRKAGIEI